MSLPQLPPPSLLSPAERMLMALAFRAWRLADALQRRLDSRRGLDQTH